MQARAVRKRIAVLKPTPPFPPSNAWAGTRQLSKMTSAVWEPRNPIFLFRGPIVIPGVSFSTRNAEMPDVCSLEPVRANTVKIPACGELVVKRLVTSSGGFAPPPDAR